MKIKFEGVYELPDEDIPDDSGTIDNWLVLTIKEVIDNGPELDDIYKNLKLDWKIVDNEN